MEGIRCVLSSVPHLNPATLAALCSEKQREESHLKHLERQQWTRYDAYTSVRELGMLSSTHFKSSSWTRRMIKKKKKGCKKGNAAIYCTESHLSSRIRASVGTWGRYWLGLCPWAWLCRSSHPYLISTSCLQLPKNINESWNFGAIKEGRNTPNVTVQKFAEALNSSISSSSESSIRGVKAYLCRIHGLMKGKRLCVRPWRTSHLWLFADGRHKNIIMSRTTENKNLQKASSTHSSIQSFKTRLCWVIHLILCSESECLQQVHSRTGNLQAWTSLFSRPWKWWKLRKKKQTFLGPLLRLMPQQIVLRMYLPMTANISVLVKCL